MKTIPDVMLIGGGVIGLTTAFELAKAHVRVCVVDKGDLGQESSWAGAGIISPGNPARARTVLGRLKAEGARLFPLLSAELQELTGMDNGYLRCGGLELRRSSDALERQRIANLLKAERGEGLSCHVLDSESLHALEPNLSAELPGAVHFPEMAQVRNPWHLRALVAACEKLGVQFHRHVTVREFEVHGQQINAVRSDQHRLEARNFIVTSGAWSEKLLNSIGLRTGIKPIRGQIVLYHAGRQLFRHILQVGSEYLVPRADGRILVGSTEEDVGFEKQNTEEAIAHLRRLAESLVPALAETAIERCWAGLRPGNADGKPVLGRAPRYENLYIAAGHFRSGIHLSAITALLMKQLVLQEPLAIPLDTFWPSRFGRGEGEPAQTCQALRP